MTIKEMTMQDVKDYETEQYTKAFMEGTPESWNQYRANVKRVVNKFNKTHKVQIDYDALTE